MTSKVKILSLTLSFLGTSLTLPIIAEASSAASSAAAGGAVDTGSLTVAKKIFVMDLPEAEKTELHKCTEKLCTNFIEGILNIRSTVDSSITKAFGFVAANTHQPYEDITTQLGCLMNTHLGTIRASIIPEGYDIGRIITMFSNYTQDYLGVYEEVLNEINQVRLYLSQLGEHPRYNIMIDFHGSSTPVSLHPEKAYTQVHMLNLCEQSRYKNDEIKAMHPWFFAGTHNIYAAITQSDGVSYRGELMKIDSNLVALFNAYAAGEDTITAKHAFLRTADLKSRKFNNAAILNWGENRDLYTTTSRTITPEEILARNGVVRPAAVDLSSAPSAAADLSSSSSK
jgi:hypothetical protein